MLGIPMLEKTYLEDGKLVVFRRGRWYQARIYLSPRRYAYKALKTTDPKVAVSSAVKLFHVIGYKVQQGHPVVTRSFSSAIDAYIEHRERLFEQGHTKSGMLRQIKRVSKF